MKISFCIVFIYLLNTAFAAPIPARRYVCNTATNICEQQPVNAQSGTGMTVCRMICDPHASLWPLPTGPSKFGNQVIPIQLDKISFSQNQPDTVKPLVDAAIKFFLEVIDKTVTKVPTGGRLVISTIVIKSDNDISLETDESYTLLINRTTFPDGDGASVTITAQTFFGMRHGLETLSQLVTFDEVAVASVILSSANIQDAPKFPFRGVILDTNRQFYPLESLRHLVDAMAFTKMNYFHWHFTDTSSFPFESLAVPNMTIYGAFSPDMVYRQSDIVDFVFYAKSRGVRVIPELDAPAHEGNGWDWGASAGKGNLAVCVREEPWEDFCLEPPCGQLNPTNPNLYDILGQLYQEMYSVFGSPAMFHMGGDEVKLDCWNSTAEIIAWLEAHNRGRTESDFFTLWGEFQQQAYSKLQTATKSKSIPILWTNDLVNSPEFNVKYVPPSEYIVEVWDFSTSTTTVPDLLDLGYRLLIANADAWYLDCGFGGWVNSGNNWCSPYKGWQLMYDNKPYESLNGSWIITDPAQRKNLLGGEAALWSEQADAFSMDSRIWPRASAVAERLWSDPQGSWLEADDRMQLHRARLVSRGVGADTIQPEWCLQNQGKCTLKNVEDVDVDEDEESDDPPASLLQRSSNRQRV